MGIKTEVSQSELMFYLEEMVQMGLADEIEESFYEDCQWDGFSKVKQQRKIDLRHIIHNYRAWQEVNF